MPAAVTALPHSRTLESATGFRPRDREALIDAMVDAGVGKINFAGGEPTLMRDLGPLCERIKRRSRSHCAVSLVTNGAGLRPLLEDWADWIDWVALSVDSGDDSTNVALGRTRTGRPYAPVMVELGVAAKRRGVRLKCNTVVSRLNVGEDMCGYISELRRNAGSCSRCCRSQARTMAPCGTCRSRRRTSERSLSGTCRWARPASPSYPKTMMR